MNIFVGRICMITSKSSSDKILLLSPRDKRKLLDDTKIFAEPLCEKFSNEK